MPPEMAIFLLIIKLYQVMGQHQATLHLPCPSLHEQIGISDQCIFIAGRCCQPGIEGVFGIQ